MRSKFSPRQKVVSFALAILTLGVLVILGYRLLGNIFAADQTTGQKKKVDLVLNNWQDAASQTYFHQVFSATNREKFRCSVVSIYVNNPSDKAELQTAVRDIVNFNPGILSIGSSGSREYIDALLLEYKVNESGITQQEQINRKIKALEDYNKTVLPNSIYKSGVLRTECDRGGGAGSSIDYGTIKIPPKYASAGATSQPAAATDLVCARVVPDGTNDSAPTSYKWVERELLGADYVSEPDTTKCGPKPTTGATTDLVCARDVTEGSGDKYIWIERSLTGGADYVLEPDTTKCGPKPTTGATGGGNDSYFKEVKVSVSVKTQEGLAVGSARVQIDRLDQFNRVLAGTSSDYITTNESGNAETTIKIAGTDSEKIKQIQATAQKLSQTQSKQVAWSSQSEVSFQFVLNLSSTEAGTEQNWTATGGEEPYIAPIIDYDAKWPGGPNSIDLIAVRRSMHNANYNGYTPVGGVEFYINVYTNAPPATARRTQDTLGAEKALAQDDDGDNSGDAQIPPLGNNEYGFKETNNNYQSSGTGNTPVGAPLPYNQNEVTPYNSSLLRALREKNQTKYSYGSRGRIVDNGLNSGVTIGNLPSGIYDIELRKSNFYSSRFILFVNNSNGAKKISLPIAPRTYAEPPSIDSGKIDKQPNKDVYSAKGYVYVSKYPWFGWQKENEYIYQKPYIANGVPTTMGDNGQPIGGIYGSPEMQACIGKKMQSVGVGVSGLSMKDVLLGAGGAYLLKQSGKQNDDWVKGGMIAGGIYSLIELAKSSEAKVNINYDQFDCAELIYGRRNTVPMGCETCFMNVDGGNPEELQRQADANCDPRCMLQYSPLMNITSLLPFGNLFGNK